jgi:PAS domain S-box-containing protein
MVCSKELQKVSLQLKWLHEFQFAGYYIAKEKGYYKEVGLDVEIKEAKKGSNFVQEVLDKKSTYGISDSALIYSRLLGKPVVALSAIYQHSPLALLTTKESGISTPKDLKNKKIMMYGDNYTNLSILSMLKSQGIDKNNFINAPISFDINDLVNGKIDAFSVYISDQPYQLKSRGIGYNLITPMDYGFDFYGDILFTSEEELKNNPQRVKNFYNATIKGWEYAFSNIDETIELIAAKYNTQKRSKELLRYEADILKKLSGIDKNIFGKLDDTKVSYIANIYSIFGYSIDKKLLDGFIYNPDNINLNRDEKEFIDTHTINFGTIKNMPPFFIRAQESNSGIVVDYLNIIKDDIGLKIAKDITNLDHSIEKLKSKEVDISYASFTKPIEGILYTKPFLEIPMVIATKRDKKFISNLSKLNGKKIAIRKECPLFEIVSFKYPRIEYIRTKNIQESLDLLNDSKVDAVLDALPILSYSINNSIYSDIKISGQTDIDFKLKFLVRDDYPILVDIINKSIDNLSYEQKEFIYNKWINIHYEQSVDYLLIWQIGSVLALLILLSYVWNYRLRDEINKRKALEDELRESQEIYKRLFEKSTDGICIVKDYKFIDCNISALKMFGLDDKDEVIDNSTYIYSPKYQPDGVESEKKSKDMIDIALNRGTNRYEWIYIKKDKREFWAEIVLTKIRVKNENLIHVVIRNITNRKRLEASLKELNDTLEKRVEEQLEKNRAQEQFLIQQSRLASMGEMIGNIAHQWRQPLNSLGTLVMELETKHYYEDGVDDGFVDEFVDKCDTTLQYLSKTIDDFRNFFQPSKEMSLFNIQKLLQEVEYIMQIPLSNNDISLYIECSVDIEINSYKNELKQVIINIINNAKDALKESDNSKKEHFIRLKVDDRSNSILLSIIDNAGGVPEEIIDKIFDPYFTTKFKSQGTGLGLYMSKTIVESSMDGVLEVTNSTDGAIFTIEIPKQMS